MATPTTALTPRQAEILAFLRAYRAAHGFPPTTREIRDHFGMRSPNSPYVHLRKLQDKGLLTLTPGAARGIRLVEDADDTARRLAEAIAVIRFALVHANPTLRTMLRGLIRDRNLEELVDE